MNRNSHYWINKNKRKEKAIKHTDDMERLYAKEIAESVKHTKLYSDNTVMIKHPKTTDKMVVVDADSVSAIFRYHEEGKKMAVLNFASYKNPGGMFLNGSSAQEESLCHSPFLYNVLSNIKQKTAFNFSCPWMNAVSIKKRRILYMKEKNFEISHI